MGLFLQESELYSPMTNLAMHLKDMCCETLEQAIQPLEGATKNISFLQDTSSQDSGIDMDDTRTDELVDQKVISSVARKLSFVGPFAESMHTSSEFEPETRITRKIRRALFIDTKTSCSLRSQPMKRKIENLDVNIALSSRQSKQIRTDNGFKF